MHAPPINIFDHSMTNTANQSFDFPKLYYTTDRDVVLNFSRQEEPLHKANWKPSQDFLNTDGMITNALHS